MATMAETHGTIILRDGVAVAQSDNVLRWFLRNTSTSMDHALAHEGYSLAADDDRLTRGWMLYLQTITRRGYGIDGYVCRTLAEIASLISGGRYSEDALMAREVFAPTLSAIIAALMWTESHGLSAIRGELDGGVRTLAARVGIDGDAL